MANNRNNNNDYVFSLSTIWDAFYASERSLLGKGITRKERFHGTAKLKVFVFAFPSNYEKNPDKKCKKLIPNNSVCYDVWIPTVIQQYIGGETETSKNIMIGNGRSKTQRLQDELEIRSLQLFHAFLDHLENTIETHIMIFTCLKNNNVFADSLTVREVKDEIQSKLHDEYNYNLNKFKKEMLRNILASKNFRMDTRIMKTKFYDLVREENRSTIECITILSLLCLFTGCKMKDEEYFFNNILFKALYNKDKILNQPKDDSIDVTKIKIDHKTIWEAGKLWYDNSIIARHKISKPICDILPQYGSLPVYAHTKETSDQPLIEKLKEIHEHLFLIGEGGIGKTTALYSIMESAYDKEDFQQVPLYIELSKAYNSGDFDKEDHSSNYIINSVLRLVQDSINTKRDITPEIIRLFTQPNDIPEFVLLLDGLNETSYENRYGIPIVTMIKNEIKDIMVNYSNVRVILTSRSEESLGANINVTQLYFSGLKKESIIKYLEEKKFTSEDIHKIEDNNTLIETLRIPLFLVLYAKTGKNKEFLSRGEILHSFFTQTKENVYTERNNAIRIANVGKATKLESPSILFFIMDFIVPEIAWQMSKDNIYQVSNTIIEKTIDNVLFTKSATPCCWQYGGEFFDDEYLSLSEDDTNTVLQNIINLFGSDIKTTTKRICDYLVKQLGLLVISGKRKTIYKFVHEHYRDYFAALHHINRLKLAIYVNEEYEENDLAKIYLSEWMEAKLPNQVLSFIGEALGELHNVPKYDQQNDEWTHNFEYDYIKRGFDIFRFKNQYDEDKDICGFAVWNLFQILKIVRVDLSGEDLSDLDLSECSANGCRLGNSSKAATFTGSIMSDQFFMPYGHSKTVFGVDYSPDGKLIVTTSYDGSARVWNANTFEEIGVLQCHTLPFVHAQFDPSGNNILTVHWPCSLGIVDVQSLVPKIERSLHEIITSVQYSLNGDIVFITPESKIQIVDSDLNKIADSLYNKIFNKCAHLIHFSANGAYIITAFRNTAHIWDALSHENELIGTIDADSMITYVQTSPDERKIITGLANGKILIWDVEKTTHITTAPEAELFGHTDRINCIQYRPPLGDCILTASADGTVRVWNSKTNTEVPNGTINLIIGNPPFAQYSPDGKYMVTPFGDEEKEYYPIIWDAFSLEKIPGGVLKGHDNTLRSAMFTPDGSTIITIACDGTTKMWDINTFDEVSGGRLSGYKNNLLSLQYSRNSEYSVTVSIDGIVRIWNNYPTNVVGTISETEGVIVFAQLRYDNKHLLTVKKDGTCKIWDIASKKAYPIGVLRSSKDNEPHLVNYAEYSPFGDYIVTASKDGFTRKWDANKFTLINESCGIGYFDMDDCIDSNFNLRSNPIKSSRYSPDGKCIITVCEHWGAQIYDAETLNKIPEGFLVRKIEINGRMCSGPYSGHYSPKGSYIVTTYDDGIVLLWDPNTYTVLQDGVLVGHESKVTSAQFDTEENYLVTSSIDGTTIVWKIEPSVSDNGHQSFTKIHTIHNIQGLEVWNVDLRKISNRSSLSDLVKDYLSEYGAKVEVSESYQQSEYQDYGNERKEKER